MIASDPSDNWLAYTQRIANLVQEKLEISRVIIVPIEDRYLHKGIRETKFKTRLTGNLRRADAHWARQQGEIPTWIALAEAVLFSQEATGSDDKILFHKQFLDRPYTYHHVLHDDLRSATIAPTILFARIDGRGIDQFCDDFTYVSNAISPDETSPKLYAVVCCDLAGVSPAIASVVAMQDAAREFELGTRKQLESGAANIDEALLGDENQRLTRAIAGLAAGSIHTAIHCVLTLQNIGDRTAKTTQNIDPNRRLYRSCVLSLLELRFPTLVEEARRIGILGEVVYGLQRAALLSVTAERGGIGEVIGEDMPAEYRDAVSNVAFLRWFSGLVAGALFTDPDLIRFVDEATKSDLVSIGLGKLYKMLEAAPLLDDEVPESTDPHGFFADEIAKTILMSAGYASQDVSTAHSGLAQLAEPTRLTDIRKLCQVAMWLSDHISPKSFDPLRDFELRDMRRLLFIGAIATQIVEDIPLKLEEDVKSIKNNIDELKSKVPSGKRTAKRSPFNIFNVAWMSQSVVGTSPLDLENLFNAVKARTLESLENRLKIYMGCLVEIKKLEGALQDLSFSPIEGIVSGAVARRTSFDEALRGVSNPSAWRLDVRAERLRFQWLTLRKNWVHAGRVLAEFRRMAQGRAEISEAELLIMEGQLSERQGRLKDALESYLEVTRSADPSVDPSLWSRAQYGYLRTSLRLRGKPLPAALAGAVAILDLESQRRADYALLSSKDRFFMSFRGRLRPVAKQLRSAVNNSIQDSFFEIDEDRKDYEDFDPTIHLWLLTSEAIVILLSRDYFESPWCIYEFHTALHLRRFEGRALGWLFMDEGASLEDRKNPRNYVMSLLVGAQIQDASISPPAYRNERINRLFELGSQIGEGVYAHSNIAGIASAIEGFVKTAVSTKRNSGRRQ